MATGRIGTTPTLRTRWSKAPAGGTTSLSGLDDNSVSLVYDVGYEAVYRNGVLLSRTNDYTATSGTSITLIDATIAGDVIEVFANQSIPLTNTYTQTVADGKFINNTLVDAKGDILTATADNTPARLAVGANDTVLTADSSTATGLKWATPAAGGMTLISTTTLTGASVTLSSIPQTYNNLFVVVRNYLPATDFDNLNYRFNADNTASRHRMVGNGITQQATALTFNGTAISTTASNDNSVGTGLTTIFFPDYTNTSTWKKSSFETFTVDPDTTTNFQHYLGYGYYNQIGAITSLQFLNGGGNFTSGTILLYGVK